MGCCGEEREKPVLEAQKWDYINLSDFKSPSCFTPFSYGILIISLIISVACYAVDVFTAVNLLLFDRWSGQIQPVVKLSITRWIFAGCIILSWVLLVYRFLKAFRAIRSGGVAKSYLDPLAVRLQSIRPGKRGRGWRRFLVFAELTKSKKGSEYVALFAYFSFEAWLRIIFAEGPRNVINGMTLYSVMQAKLIPTGSNAPSQGHTPIVQFFVNLKILADGNHEQAAILLGMLFTIIVWVISFISLIVACILYIMFLWHHIPSQDGGLRGFLKRKIDSRVQKIVDIKIKKALAKENFSKSKETLKGGESKEDLKRQPTLPVLGDDQLPEMPMLTKQDTQGTLPPYLSRSGTPVNGFDRQPTLPSINGDRPGMPSRTNTMSSNASYASNAPLIGNSGDMGFGPPGRNYPPMPPSRMNSDMSAMGGPQGQQSPYTPTGGPPRSFTPQGGSQRSYTPVGAPPGPGRMPGGLMRQNTGMSDASNRSAGGPMRQNAGMNDFSEGGRSTPVGPARQNTGMSDYPNGRSTPGGGPFPRSNSGTSNYNPYAPPSQRPPPINTQNQQPLSSPTSSYGRNTPINSTGRQTPQEFEMKPQAPVAAPSRFQAYNPNTATSPRTGAPVRNFTAPMRSPQHDYFNTQLLPPQRSATGPIPQSAGYLDSIYDSYGGEPSPTMPGRAATASPRGGYGPGGAI